MAGKKDVQYLIKQLARDGFLIRRTGGGHYRVVCPTTGSAVTIPMTPSDKRGLLNSRRDLRRRLGAAV